MKENLFKQLLLSFYDFKKVSVYRFQSIGKAIGYLFFIMLIAIIPTSVKMIYDTNLLLDETRTIMTEDVPAFEVKDGVLITENGKPVIINEDNVTIIIDPTEQTTSKKFLNETTNGLALLKDSLAIVIHNQSYTLGYDTLNLNNMTKEDFLNYIDDIEGIKGVLLTLVIAIFYLFTTALKFIGVSFLALIGLLIRKQQNKNLNYKQLWVLSTYTVTLPTILFSFITVLSLQIPYANFVYWLIASSILYKVITYIPSPKNR